MSNAISLEFLNQIIPIVGISGFTQEGGMYTLMENRTGATSVKGTVVSASDAYDNACMITGSSSQTSPRAIGVIYEDGVPDGGVVKVITAGRAQVLLQNMVETDRGDWAGSSTSQAGRCICQNQPNSVSAHFRQLGYCLQEIQSPNNGPDVLCLILLQIT